MSSLAHGGKIRPILFAASAAIVVSLVGTSLTDLGPWYQALEKPGWQPPGWVFGAVWTAIFALAAASGVQAWRAAPGQRTREWIIGLFALNGFLNITWSLLFFRLQRPDLALYEVVFFWASILFLIVYFWKFSRSAALLLVPYLIWVAIAAALNLSIVQLNGLG